VIPPDPTPDDLQPWARRAFEDAYRRRPREQASREDVAYGFLRALVWARVASAFQDDGQLPEPAGASPSASRPPQQERVMPERVTPVAPSGVARFPESGVCATMAGERNRRITHGSELLAGDCGQGHGPPLAGDCRRANRGALKTPQAW